MNDTNITDQLRTDAYIEEPANPEKGRTIPNGTNPTSQTPRAMVSDNGLAPGRK